MNLPNPFAHKSFKYILILTSILCLVYVFLRLVFFPSDFIIPLLSLLYEPYLYLAEGTANLLYKFINADVIIKDHKFIFENETAYQLAYTKFLTDWPKWLLYKNWSILILVLIWANTSTIRKKIVFTFSFFIIHFFSVVSGLYLLGVAGPELFEIKPKFPLSPTLIGTFFMFALLVVWLKKSKNEILNTLQKLKIQFTLADKKINEILVLLFIFLLLRTFIISFFDFPLYVNFLLESTRVIASLFHYEGYIDGDQLIGEFGALGLSKHCLGFMTIFVFASGIYLTRTKNNKASWLYITSGLVFLHFLNMIRLILLFILVQGDNGLEVATYHHDVYNIIVYAIIFVLWVVWFEVFVGKKKITQAQSSPHHTPRP